MSGRFDPQLFFEKADHLALRLEASEIFGWLNRSLDLPSRWAALVTKKTGDRHLVAAGAAFDGVDADDILFFRVSPFDVAIDAEHLTSSDGFDCRASVSLRMRLIPDAGDVRSFAGKVLGSHRVAKVEAVERYVESDIRATLSSLVANKDAGSLSSNQALDEAAAAVNEALQSPCFAAGLALDAEPVVRFESATLRDVRHTQQKAIRQQAQHEAAQQIAGAYEQARATHVEHLTTLLARLTELSQSSPNVGLAELLRTFSESERGELYQSLLTSSESAKRTQWIVVAAGEELLFFDPDGAESPARRVNINLQAGAVRSVQLRCDAQGKPILWLGGATGVYRMPVDSSTPDMTFTIKNAPDVRGGFNSVDTVGDRVIASHSELGLCEWHTSDPHSARPLFAPLTKAAKAVRHALWHDGDLYASVDNHIIRWPADATTDAAVDQPAHVFKGSVATITAICPSPQGLLAGNADGDILFWPSDSQREPERLHMGTQRAAESLWLTKSQGINRVIFADTSLHVYAKVLGDSYVCRYQAGGQTLRRVEVADDVLVATSDLRDRLICWKPNSPDKPYRTIGISRICGSSVQDVCLVGAD